ncbi:hypothetical protein A2U01_0008740 [Trifolium medium]|uniref:Uncharacterized protein n=1 Tax=Trifolium medium TaxID=97028 RepID=A0A392MLL6_9FABA|nr:hypothetical protein [Trifolium medium]
MFKLRMVEEISPWSFEEVMWQDDEDENLTPSVSLNSVDSLVQ